MPQTNSSVAASGSPPMKILGPVPPLVPGRPCWPPAWPAGGGGAKGRGIWRPWAVGIESATAGLGGTVMPLGGVFPMLPGGGVFLPIASASLTLSTFPSSASACSAPLRAPMQSSASLKEVKVTKAHGLASALLAKILVWVTKPNCWQTSLIASSVACCPMLPMKTFGCCWDLPFAFPFTSANFTLMPSPKPPSNFRPLSACTAASAEAHEEKEQNAQPFPSRRRKFEAPYGTK
mmetsp:Transcript_13274/g.41946  ORF Transcript_13274/g.41946 Transcript_13274/m.41946 type:complete len:234 (-) Transcript_13274:197-898(-)